MATRYWAARAPIVAAVAIVLLGCAGIPQSCLMYGVGCDPATQESKGYGQQGRYDKPGATAEDFRIDSGQCRAQAAAAPTLIQFGMIYDGCMQGKGWHRVG